MKEIKELVMTKKKKYEIEFEIKSSPKILFPYIATASGLSEWFSDDVRQSDHLFTFIWEGVGQKAKLVTKKENSLIRFAWVDDPENTWFEIEIVQDDITSDVAIVVRDFSVENEIEENQLVWQGAIQKLMRIIGS